MVGVALGVVAVAQHGMGHGRLAEDTLGFAVLTGQRTGRVIGIKHAGVHDARDPGGLRGLDDVGVLRDEVADFAAGDK